MRCTEYIKSIGRGRAVREYDYICGGIGGQAVRRDVDACVGFADCPCKRCRATRLAATEAHKGGHVREWPAGTFSPLARDPYCGVCRTEERARYRA